MSDAPRSTRPAHVLTRTYATADLRSFVDGPGPYLTVELPTPSELADAEHRLAIRWRNARRQVEGAWPDDLLEQLDQTIAELTHGESEAVVILQRADGTTFIEALTSGLTRELATTGDQPRLVEIVEHRQRTLPHLVVATDHTGADIGGFDRGETVLTAEVEGTTHHIHRIQGGGWSHRRIQQRAENRVEDNADLVGEAVRQIAADFEPALVAIAGEVRSRHLVEAAIEGIDADVVMIEAGDPDGIATETLRAVADLHARLQRAVIEDARDRWPVVDPADVLQALAEGRVETLLVDGTGDHVDGAIAQALATDAGIVVVPSVPELSGGLAAIPRW